MKITINPIILLLISIILSGIFCKTVDLNTENTKYRCSSVCYSDRTQIAQTVSLDLTVMMNEAGKAMSAAGYEQFLVKLEKEYRNNTVIIPAYTEYEISVNGY
jgi:hypothetical protein